MKPEDGKEQSFYNIQKGIYLSYFNRGLATHVQPVSKLHSITCAGNLLHLKSNTHRSPVMITSVKQNQNQTKRKTDYSAEVELAVYGTRLRAHYRDAPKQVISILQDIHVQFICPRHTYSSLPVSVLFTSFSCLLPCHLRVLGWPCRCRCKLADVGAHSRGEKGDYLPAVGLLLTGVFEESTKVTSDDIASGLVATAEPFLEESRRGMVYVCVVF